MSLDQTGGGRPRNALRDLLLGSLANYAFPVAALITSPILARGLGPDGRGALAALLTPLTVADAIAAVGTPLAANYFISAGADERTVRRHGAIIATVAGALAVGLLIAVSGPLLAEYPELRLTFVLLTPTVLLGGYINLFRGIRAGQEAYGQINANLWAGALSRLVAIVALAVAGLMTPTTVAVLSLATGLLSGLALYRRYRARASAGPPFKPFLSYSLRGWFGTLSSSVTARVDQLLLITMVPAAALGNYAVAVTVAEIPNAVSLVVQRLLLVRSAAGASRDLDTTLSGMRLATAFNVVVAGSVFLAADLVVAVLFGSAYQDAPHLLRLLVVGTAAWGISQSATGLLLGVGRPGASSTADVTSAVVTIGAIYPAVALAGTTGAAAVASLAYSLAAVVKLVVVRRALGTTWPALLVVRRSDLQVLGQRVRRLVRR